VPEVPALTFTTTRRLSVVDTVGSLLALEWGGPWSVSRWTIWAVTPDGERFQVRRVDDRASALQTIQAYEGQLRVMDPSDWAASKGVEELAARLARGRARTSTGRPAPNRQSARYQLSSVRGAAGSMSGVGSVT
jgi:hypothetical protein